MRTAFQLSNHFYRVLAPHGQLWGRQNCATASVTKIVDNVSAPRPALPEGSMRLEDFLDTFEARPDIAPHLPAARRELADYFEQQSDRPTLRRLRLKKGLSQKELALLLGTSQAAISDYENRTRKPNEDTIRNLAQSLEVDFNTLMDALANG